MKRWTTYVLIFSVAYPFLLVLSVLLLSYVEENYSFNPVPIFGAELLFAPVLVVIGMLAATYKVQSYRRAKQPVKLFIVAILFYFLLLLLVTWKIWGCWSEGARAIV